jgi:DNA-binding MarR family transcriptional regulator
MKNSAANPLIYQHKFQVISLFHRTYNLMTRCEDEVEGKVGITTPHFGVLLALETLDKPVTVSILAAHLNRAQNNVTMILDRMAKLGLIKRTRNLKDRRAIRVTMTPRGKASFEMALGLLGEIYAKIDDGIDEDDWKYMEKMMLQISKNFSGCLQETSAVKSKTRVRRRAALV